MRNKACLYKYISATAQPQWTQITQLGQSLQVSLPDEFQQKIAQNGAQPRNYQTTRSFILTLFGFAHIAFISVKILWKWPNFTLLQEKKSPYA